MNDSPTTIDICDITYKIYGGHIYNINSDRKPEYFCDFGIYESHYNKPIMICRVSFSLKEPISLNECYDDPSYGYAQEIRDGFAQFCEEIADEIVKWDTLEELSDKFMQYMNLYTNDCYRASESCPRNWYRPWSIISSDFASDYTRAPSKWFDMHKNDFVY